MYVHHIIILFITSFPIIYASEECVEDDELLPIAKEKLLRQDLLCNYNKHFVPLTNRTEIMSLSLAVEIVQYDIHEHVPKKLHLSIEITMSWNDAFLKWNPNQYGGINEIFINTNEIWKPNLMPEEMEFISKNPPVLDDVECKITSAGNVTCIATSGHYGFCYSNIRRWPYDVHICEVQYIIWSEDEEKLQIDLPANDTLTIRETKAMNTWKITEMATHTFTGRPQLNIIINELYFEFTLVRNFTGKKLYTFFISILGLTAFSLLCFWTKFDSIDRLIITLINVNCHFFEMQNIMWKFPRLGNTIPYIMIFYRDSLIISFIIFAETIFLKKLFASDKPIPSWLYFIDKLLNKNIIKKILLIEDETNEQKSDNETFEDELNFIRHSKDMEKKRIILILDRIVFIGFLVTYFIMISILLTF